MYLNGLVANYFVMRYYKWKLVKLRKEVGYHENYRIRIISGKGEMFEVRE